MNPVEQVLDGDLSHLLDRLATTVPNGCLAAARDRTPALKRRLDDVDAQLAQTRAALLEGYGRWCRALEDVENLWALAACRSTAEEPSEPSSPIAA